MESEWYEQKKYLKMTVSSPQTNIVHCSIKKWMITIFGVLVNVLWIDESTIDGNLEKIQ